jgi:ribosomal protein S18 acetylase RimI-like enzyme
LTQECDLKEPYQQIAADLQLAMVTIRPAVSEDAGGIARTFLESAEHHSSLDSELYFVPAFETIVLRYREGRQHSYGTGSESITLVADFDDEIVGFIDARLDQSPDAMHRDVVFCHIAEIAVSRGYQSRGIGTRLLQSAEGWGRQQGASLALLEYHSANAQASAFYRRRMGYRVTSITATKSL